MTVWSLTDTSRVLYTGFLAPAKHLGGAPWWCSETLHFNRSVIHMNDENVQVSTTRFEVFITNIFLWSVILKMTLDI